MKIYLAGPMYPTDNNWRNTFKVTMKNLFKSFGYNKLEFYDPDEFETYKVNIVNIDKWYIDKCDIVFANVTRLSVGTSMEIIYAWIKGKPVILVCPDNLLSPWHKYHVTAYFNSMDAGIAYIQEEIFPL